jgi:hypothetical protein
LVDCTTAKYIIHPAKYHISAAILVLEQETLSQAVDLFQSEVAKIVCDVFPSGDMPVPLHGINDFEVCVCVSFPVYRFVRLRSF